MLYEVMKSIRNFFYTGKDFVGEIKIEDNQLHYTGMDIKPGQYFLIEGSIFNNGVYCYGSEILTDETFTGRIALLAPPRAFIDTVEEITKWQEQYGTVANTSPYQSESFGGYSYTRATNKNGDAVCWRDQFKSRLKLWRKV